MTDSRPEPLLLPGKEAARILGISTRTLWTLSNMGAIPSIRIGRAVRYSVSDLHLFIDNQRRSGDRVQG